MGVLGNLFGDMVRETGSHDAPLFVIATLVALRAHLFSRIDPSQPLVAEPEPARAT